MPQPHDLTPSEIVLLRCDDFAPVPPLTLGARIRFEFDFACGFLIAMFFATAFVVSANQTGHPAAARVIGALADLALVATWWYFRRRKDPFFDREEVCAIRPLGGTRAAVHPQLIQLTISAALLANERAGALRLENEDGQLTARFNSSDPHWPPDSLEDRLRRARPIRVSELVYDWMGDGSNFPLMRALRLIEHSASLRGLACTQPNLADTAKPEPVKALLEECRLRRPAIWKALQADISAGVKSRTVEPRREQIGRMSVPKYDYNEAPISALDIPAHDTSQGSVKAFAPKYMPIWTTLLVTALLIGATVFTVMEYHKTRWDAAVLTAIGMFAGLQTCELLAKRAKQHRKRLRQEYGLPPEPDLAVGSLKSNLPQSRWQQRLASWAMLAAIAALPVAIWGAWTAIFPLLLIVIILLASTWRLPKELAAEVVAARIKALAAAAADALTEDPATPNTGEPVSASARDRIDSPQPALSRAACLLLPQPTAAHDLPPASPEIAESLDRWTHRRARFRRLHWISLGVLIGGYTLMELAFWFIGSTPWIKVSDISDNIPFGLLFMLAATGIGFVYWRGSGAVEDGSGNTRHGGLALMISVWRIFALVQAPLLFTTGIDQGREEALKRHPIFVASVLLFLLLHWMWMEWAMARAMRDYPVPSPRRLVLLRVFGSPAFDDLVTLIGPWQTVGLIEHLEGFDTVGTRGDVQAAVDSGKVDRILAKDMAEVRDQLARENTGPDRALRFRRHAFQCTNATWRQAILAMLDRADAVLMDLSSLSVERQGCAWELCQLLYRVPLANLTLLVNDSTDLECLRSILDNAAEHMPPDSPNRSNPAAWQLISIGGLQARQPNESFYEWTRRIDIRLDPRLLTSWLLSTARPAAGKEAATDVFRFSAGISWAGQARWSWLVLLALSTALALEQWVR